MWQRIVPVGIVAVGLVLGGRGQGPARAQPPGGQDSPAQQVVRSFDAAAPAVGQPLPPLTILDAQGQPFELTRLKGQPTVLVFGCLT